MPTPIEAYRAGYEKARQDDLGGTLAEVTMGMLRDDPDGNFAAGYHDGAAGKKFNPPSTPTPSRPQTGRLIPKFSENPFGWFMGVIIVVEFWTLWQLIKAPFQLIGALLRSEKPSVLVIVKNVIVAALTITLVWWVPHVNEMRGPSSYQTPSPASDPSTSVVEANGGRVVQGTVTNAMRRQGLHLWLTTSEGTAFDAVIITGADVLDGTQPKTKFVEMPPGSILRNSEGGVDYLQMNGFRVRIVCAENDAVAPYCTALSVRRMQ